MTFFTKKEQLVIILLILVIVFIAVFSFLNKKILTNGDENLNNDVDVEDIITNLEEEDIHENQFIMIHISGQIYSPGIIELDSGSRLIDAVNLAGGLKKDADLDRINLAKRLLDEEKIYIPKIGEEDTPIEIPNQTIASNSGGVESKIDINICTKEELITLPGIGEVLAGRILDYREENLFKTIDDIKNVSGIGEKKYDSIKELITVKWRSEISGNKINGIN